MSQYKNIATITAAGAALAFYLAIPAFAQTENNLNVVQPPPLTHAEPEAQAQVPQPEAIQPVHVKKKTHVAQHKHLKKKGAHKTSAKAHKKHSKKIAAHKSKTKTTKHKKKTAARKAPTKETHHSVVSPVEVGRTVKKRAPDASMAVVPVKKSPDESLARTSGAGKSVAYNFCLGYDNCIPHRYEASIQSGKASNVRITQKDDNGNWSESKVDPTMKADLDKMAQSESGGRIERDLTPDEKEQIADHQGKVHATLVSEVKAGPDKKEEIKTMMRELRIQNLNDLDAYDPRLRQHEIAVQAVNEISVGR